MRRTAIQVLTIFTLALGATPVPVQSATAAENKSVNKADSMAAATDGENGLERAAGVGLLAAIGSATAGLIAVRRRKLRGPGPAQTGRRWAEAPVPFPEQLPARGVALNFGKLLESTNEWVHRRVESVEFLDVRTIRRRVSVDFTPPASTDGTASSHAPIALLRKNVLTRFDLRDEAGNSLPLLTSSQNAAFATEYMLGLAAEASPEPIPVRLRNLCWQIARAETPEAERAFNEIASDPGLASWRDGPLLRAGKTFAGNFAVIVPIDKCGERRVIKLAYDEVVSGGPKVLARLGLKAATFVIRLPDLGDAGSRHLEFLRADGLEIFDAAIFGRTPKGESLQQRTSAQAKSEEAHLFIAGAPQSSDGIAGVRLRTRREGILAGGPPLATLAAGALTAVWFALPDVAVDSSGAASLVLAVPAALGTFFGARNLHPLAAAMLLGARGLLVTAGVCSFIAASALALDLSIEMLRWTVGGAALLSWLAVAGLVALSLLFPARSRDTSGVALQWLMDDFLEELSKALDDPDSAAWSVDTAEGGWALPTQDASQDTSKSA